MAQSEPRDIWSKITAISALIASVLIPIVVVVVGNSFSRAMKESENRIKYIELAIGILRTTPSTETANLRIWAIDIINKHSDVKLTPETQQELLHKEIILGTYTAEQVKFLENFFYNRKPPDEGQKNSK
jgi:hypothetical protein